MYTGVCLILSCGLEKRTETFSVKSDVEVYPMTEQEIQAYLSTDEPYDKAGSYAVQGHFAVHVKGIRGDYNNIVGLPIAEIYQKLKNWIQF